MATNNIPKAGFSPLDEFPYIVAFKPTITSPIITITIPRK